MRNPFVTIEDAEDADAALSAVLAWAEIERPALAILLRRCLLRLSGTPARKQSNRESPSVAPCK